MPLESHSQEEAQKRMGLSKGEETLEVQDSKYFLSLFPVWVQKGRDYLLLFQVLEEQKVLEQKHRE